MRRFWPMLWFVAAFGSPLLAHADGVAIRPDLVKPGEIKLDGVPREWPAAMTQLSKTVAGAPPPDIAMRGAIAYDETNVYVAGELKDEKLTRTAACAEGEDHASLVLAFPRGAGFAVHEVELFPGDPGKVPGCVKLKGGALPLAGARIVEAPKGVPGSYTFEALVPWNAFPEAGRVRVGLRAALRYHDGDGRAVKGVLGTATDGAPGDIPRLATEPEQSLEEGLLKEKSITQPPSFDRLADVAGDGMLERVAVYDRYMVILGPHFRDGKEYYFADLGVDVRGGQLPSFDVRDVNGDGKADIVMRKRVGSAAEWREVLAVFAMGQGDVPIPIFQHEVGIHGPPGTVENEVHLTEGSHPGIEIRPGTAKGYSAATYREPVETSMDPLLLPWGPIKSQAYEWNGKSFVKAREEKQAPGRAAESKREDSKEEPEQVTLAAAARPPSPDELQEQVYALYKRDRHVTGRERPRFDLAADLAEDGRNERVLLHGRDLVVFGKGFRNGAGYAFLTLEQFADARDIADLTARDITGDGKAEVLVRGVLHVSPPKQLGLSAAVVDREVFLVYAVGEHGISRIFGAETGRAIGNKRVQGTVAFVPEGRGVAIELRKGRAFSWSERNYPFGQDDGKQGGLEPLILPWSGARPARYHWDPASAAFARDAD